MAPLATTAHRCESDWLACLTPGRSLKKRKGKSWISAVLRPNATPWQPSVALALTKHTRWKAGTIWRTDPVFGAGMLEVDGRTPLTVSRRAQHHRSPTPSDSH